MKDNVVWLRDVLKAFDVNDLWFLGMRLFARNLSAHYKRTTEKKMSIVEIDECMNAMKILMYEENGIQIDTEENQSSEDS